MSTITILCSRTEESNDYYRLPIRERSFPEIKASVITPCYWARGGLAWYKSTKDKTTRVKLYSAHSSHPPIFPVHNYCLKITFQAMSYNSHEKRECEMPTTFEELYSVLCFRDLRDRVRLHTLNGCRAFSTMKSGLYWPHLYGVVPCWGQGWNDTLVDKEVSGTGAITLFLPSQITVSFAVPRP